MYCDNGKFKIFYKIIGQGHPILTFHGGLGYDHNYLFNTTRHLHKYAQWIFWNYPGHGKSSRNIRSSEISINNILLAAKKICETLNIEKPYLFGHSYGATIALAYAIRYPDGYERLFFNSGATLSEPYDKALKEIKYQRLSKLTGVDLAVAGSQLKTTSDFEKYIKIGFPIYFYKYSSKSIDYLKGSRLSLRALKRGFIEAEDLFPNIIRMAGTIDKDVYVAYGEKDVIIAEKNIDILRDRFDEAGKKNYCVVSFHNSAHFPQVEEQTKFEELFLRFINDDEL